MTEIQLVLLLIATVIVITAVSRRLGASTPIAMVLGGLALSFVPGIPQVVLPPELVFFGFLPPLLFAGGFFTSARDFKANLRPIILLAFGLVLFTAAVVAVVAITLVFPYVAYLPAEAIGVSGVLAAVIAGLWSRHATRHATSDARVVAAAVWQIWLFLLNGLVFFLLGLQLPHVVRAVDLNPLTIGAAVAVVVAVMVGRIVWVFPA